MARSPATTAHTSELLCCVRSGGDGRVPRPLTRGESAHGSLAAHTPLHSFLSGETKVCLKRRRIVHSGPRMWRPVQGDDSLCECTGYPAGSGCGAVFPKSRKVVRVESITPLC